MSRRKKIPTRTELMQLQKLYKTDEKIGERLGGVPAYLVAYWRRKKNIAKYSLPKFSEIDIKNLWERYGDDEKAGLELAISKAAFYNWRRKYGLKEKPAFLKLEQLELNFPGARTNGAGSQLYGKRTIAQKLYARLSGVEDVAVGQQVEIEPDMVILGNEAVSVIPLFKKHGTEYLWNPNRIVFVLDAEPVAGKAVTSCHKTIRDIAKRQAIRNLYEWSSGVGYQVALENGHLLPGQLAATTSHHSVSGSLSTVTQLITPTEMGRVFATGKLSATVPATVRITLGGRRPRAVTSVDIVSAILKQLGSSTLAGKVIEIGGSVVGQMTISERLALCALLQQAGAQSAVAPYDAATRRYLTGRSTARLSPVLPDKDAEYESAYQFYVDQFIPQLLACKAFERTSAESNQPQTAPRAVGEVESSPVQVIVIGGVAGGRFEELRQAADILKGKEVADGCRVFIVPDSRQVYLEALKKGLIRIFLEAGMTVVSPATLADQESGSLLALADGERGLSTGCRITRISAEKSELYHCSVLTAAASALNGTITDPTRYAR